MNFRISAPAFKVVDATTVEAIRHRDSSLGIAHLVLGITCIPEAIACQVIQEITGDVISIRRGILNGSVKDSLTEGELPYEDQLLDVLARAEIRAKRRAVTTEDLLIALLEEKRGHAIQVLHNHGITLSRVHEVLATFPEEKRKEPGVPKANLSPDALDLRRAQLLTEIRFLSRFVVWRNHGAKSGKAE